MTTQNVARRSVAEDLSDILDSPEVSRLIAELQATRETGRPGYPIRTMVGMTLAKSLYAIPTWTRTVALVREHAVLAAVIAPDGDLPSHWACYRFLAKLREHKPLLADCIASVVRALKKANPLLGWDVSIDASDMPAYASGKRHTRSGRERTADEFSDPDASWGHRSAVSTRGAGGFYGYKLHLAVCSKTELPLAWRVETARMNETKAVVPLLDKLHTLGIDPDTCAMDAGYDHGAMHFDCTMRGIAPVIPLRQTADVKRGEDGPPDCEHGVWKFAGADRKRGVALPDGRVQARVGMDQGQPAQILDPARNGALEGALPTPWIGRAGVRQAQARMGPRATARPAPGTRAASRRPHDPLAACVLAEPWTVCGEVGGVDSAACR